jgi:hypothetical protein
MRVNHNSLLQRKFSRVLQLSIALLLKQGDYLLMQDTVSSVLKSLRQGLINSIIKQIDHKEIPTKPNQTIILYNS